MNRDDERLRDMLAFAREAIHLASEVSADQLENNRVLSLALVKLVETIGEAAGDNCCYSLASDYRYPSSPRP